MDKPCLLCIRGPAVVRSGTIDLGKMVDEVRTRNGRFWKGKYGNRVKWFLDYYIGFY